MTYKNLLMHLFTGAKITARGLGNSIHIRALIALQLQNFLFGKHIALFKSFFQIPYTGQSVISGIITVENEKASTADRPDILRIRSVFHFPGIKHIVTLKPPQLVTGNNVACNLTE